MGSLYKSCSDNQKGRLYKGVSKGDSRLLITYSNKLP